MILRNLKPVPELALAVAFALSACGRQGYEPQVTPCTGVTCSDHGQCVLLDDKPMCICEQGYRADGLTCVEDTTVNPCLGVTCSGYGTCAVREGEAWCVCAPGYHNEGRTRCVADQSACQAADGTPCDDGQFCTVNDSCQQGRCLGVANPCDDGDTCTVDTCNELLDSCVNTTAPDFTPCDDDRFCTIGEICLAGVCTPSQIRGCSDGNACTEDLCDDESEDCVNRPVDNGTPCEDSAWCTIDDRCTDGICSGRLRDCSDGDLCSADFCDEATDQCLHEASAANGTPCDDGLFCTVEDRCSNGTCTGIARSCSDINPCTVDSCDENSQQCLHDATAADGVPCDDGAFCTIGDLCQNGSCVGGASRDCTDANFCTIDNCDEVNKRCLNDAQAANGLNCDDGLFCTDNDR